MVRGSQEGHTETRRGPIVEENEVSWGVEVSNLVRQTAADDYETRDSQKTGGREPQSRITEQPCGSD